MICIDAQKPALSHDGRGRINIPELVVFRSQKACAVGSPSLTHNKAIATSVFRENGWGSSLNGGGGDDFRGQNDGKWCGCAVLIEFEFVLTFSPSA